MQTKLLNDGREERTFVLIFQTGDKVVTSLQQFAKTNDLASSHFTAIGALSGVTFAWFDWEQEAVSEAADIALDRNQPKVHSHILVGKRDGIAYGGHLMHAHPRPTLELILTESLRKLQRKLDPGSGLVLIQP